VLPVERVSNISIETFEREYLNKNQPVIIENYIDTWPARCWTLQDLKEKAGNNEVFVRRKTALESYRAGLKYDIESMKFSEYISNMEEDNQKSYNSYLAVQNIRKALPELESDIEVPGYIRKLHAGPYLWLAQKGHYEFCHFDPDDNFLIVFSGEKHVKLYSAADLDNMYPNVLGSKGKTIQSSIDCSHPDLEKYPKFQDAVCHECWLGAGEMLFFPAFWWHQVTSTQQTISINIFFGNHGNNEYLTRIMNGDQWQACKYWFLNIIQQNIGTKQFQSVLQHLPESLTYFLLKQWHEVPTEDQLNKLIRTVLDYCGLQDLPITEKKRKHAPPLKIRGLLWR